MSQAKVHRAAKARKVWTCGKCGATINVGEPVLSFSVGFRGREQRRCDKAECYPTRSERESSMVASVYDAVDNVDWSSAETEDGLKDLMCEVAEVMREVASEYENSGMFERSEDLQERADMLGSAADRLESWEPSENAPNPEDPETWAEYPSFEAAHESWILQARDEAQQTTDEAEIP